nr:RNA-directed DNA polymerase, eukaryota [Tanacetum cinerariifolium]
MCFEAMRFFGKTIEACGNFLEAFTLMRRTQSLHLMVGYGIVAVTKPSDVILHNECGGISIGDGSVNLSHLFYADDAVFIGQWSDSNITTLVHVLECFHKLSGLRINMCKSKLMGLHVDGELVHRAARQLGCLVLNLPFSYLGSIVGDNMARQQAWGGIVDRVKKKLSKWKMKMLFIGGRLTLVKSVLGSLPIYNFSIFKVPKCVLNELEGIRRKFFNGHVQDSKKASWLNWNNVLMSKDRGGLGVSSFWTWNLEKSGMFFVASVRKMIDDALIHSPNLNYRWNKYVPIKVNILVWKILNNSLPTKFNISRRGILIDSIICPNCDVRVETVGHLFFSCSMSRDIFNLIARWWKVSIENFDCYDEWLEWIDSIRMSKKTKIMMEAVFYTSWWMIWWFRNSKIFKEKAPKKACFFDELQSKSFMWCRFRGNKSFGWNDWLNHPECISL